MWLYCDPARTDGVRIWMWSGGNENPHFQISMAAGKGSGTSSWPSWRSLGISGSYAQVRGDGSERITDGLGLRLQWCRCLYWSIMEKRDLKIFLKCIWWHRVFQNFTHSLGNFHMIWNAFRDTTTLISHQSIICHQSALTSCTDLSLLRIHSDR